MVWNALDTYVFSGVANGAVPAPTSYASPSTGQAWTDVHGSSTWSVASGVLKGVTDTVDGSQFKRDFLLAGSNTDAINQRIVTTFPSGQSLCGPYNAHRYQRTGNVGNSYLVGMAVGGTGSVILQCFILQGSGNAATQIGGNASTYTYNSSHNYALDTNVTGTNPTTISATLTDLTTSTVVATFSTTDSTATNLQQAGGYAIDITNTTGSAAAQTLSVSQLQTYSYSATSAATAIAVTGPTSGTVSTASTAFTASVNGSLASNVVFTPSSSVGGDTFTPTTVTFASGSSPANQTFTLTPSTTGARTISFTNNGGLTNPSNITYTSNASGGSSSATLPQANILFPAQGWDQSTSGHAIANASGNYLKANFTNSASGALTLTLNAATFGATPDAQKPVITWSIDNGAPQQLALTTANITSNAVTLASSLAAGTHTLQIWVRGSSPFVNHWNPGADRNFVDITGFAMASGTLVFNPIGNQLPGMLLGFGDSMMEGEGTDGFVTNGDHTTYSTYDDATHSWLPAVATALNCEYSSCAFGGQGWTTAAADGVTPGFASSWNLKYSGKAQTFSGLNYALINMGTNGNTAGPAGTVSTFLTSLRAAAGATTKIVLFIPWSSAARAGLQADFATYQGGSSSSSTADTATIYQGAADANTVLIDLGAQAAIGLALPATTNSAGSLYSYDTTHLSLMGNLRVAAMATKAIQAAFQSASGVSTVASHSYSFS